MNYFLKFYLFFKYLYMDSKFKDIKRHIFSFPLSVPLAILFLLGSIQFYQFLVYLNNYEYISPQNIIFPQW